MCLDGTVAKKGIVSKMSIFNEAEKLLPELVEIRRKLHSNPEIAFETSQTRELVAKELEATGITVQACGKGGLVACIGSGEPVFLLRADMDALAIHEEADTAFKSENGKMHACGHDMHTAMLIGAAKIIKEHEKELCGTVKLMFQSAEETLEGASDMIKAGVLENPAVDEAMMVHVMSGLPLEAGCVVVCDPGVGAPSANMFEICVRGKGTHGSMPEKGIDPLLTGAHIVTALCEINAREFGLSNKAALTVGSFSAGESANVIPDKAVICGSMRAFDNKLHDTIKQRICEIAENIGNAMRCEVNVRFMGGCPTLVNDAELSDEIFHVLKEELKDKKVYRASDFTREGNSSSGSEDFSYISAKVPSLMISVAAGDSRLGHTYPLHHPKVTFDESALAVGAAVYAISALKKLGKQ